MTWRDHAACRGQDATIWFGPGPDGHRPAVAICQTCPVRQPCLAEALADPELQGVWGGTTELQRHQIRRRTPRPCGICGRPVTPTGRPGAQRRYCTDECAHQAVLETNRRWSARRRADRAS